jgi:hypothetical protein
MKITIKLPKSAKPRNPVALSARQRKAGSHEAYNPQRHERRVAKQTLRLQLMGRREDHDD